MTEQTETRPEWGRNLNHVCDWICEMFADEVHKRQQWHAVIEAALHRAAVPPEGDAGEAVSEGEG